MKLLVTCLIIGLLASPCTDAADVPTPSPRVQKATVTRIIDGDTFTAKINKTTETIRIIGIDAPELHNPKKKVECFSQDASQNLSRLIANRDITLIDEPTGSNRDSYGRLLRYVYVQDKPFEPVTFINAEMIQGGYAYAYTRFSFRYKEQFKQYQQNARDHGRGLWAKSTCKGKR